MGQTWHFCLTQWCRKSNRDFWTNELFKMSQQLLKQCKNQCSDYQITWAMQNCVQNMQKHNVCCHSIAHVFAMTNRNQANGTFGWKQMLRHLKFWCNSCFELPVIHQKENSNACIEGLVLQKINNALCQCTNVTFVSEIVG